MRTCYKRKYRNVSRSLQFKCKWVLLLRALKSLPDSHLKLLTICCTSVAPGLPQISGTIRREDAWAPCRCHVEGEHRRVTCKHPLSPTDKCTHLVLRRMLQSAPSFPKTNTPRCFPLCRNAPCVNSFQTFTGAFDVNGGWYSWLPLAKHPHADCKENYSLFVVHNEKCSKSSCLHIVNLT